MDYNSQFELLIERCSKPNWDGYDAEPINKDSVKMAQMFISNFLNDLPLAELNIDPDGCISFDWGDEKNMFSISVSPNGMAYYGGIIDGNFLSGIVSSKQEIVDILKSVNFNG